MTATASRGSRDKLAEIRQRVRAAREERARARQVLDAAHQAGDQQAEAVAQIALDRISTDLETGEQLERMLLGQLAGVGSGTGFGVTMFETPEALATLERLANSSHPIGRVELGDALTRDQVVNLTGKALAATPGQVDPTTNMTTGPFGGISPALQPGLRFLDFLPSTPLDAPSYPYTRELGGDVGAAVVAAGSTKPAANIEYEDHEAKPRTVAAYTKLNKVSLADIDQLQARVQNRLSYGVLAALEQEVINGSGEGEHLLGILRVTGVGATASDPGSNPSADLILDGIATALKSGARPNVCALSVDDWCALLKSKSDGSGEYLAGPFLSMVQAIWGVPLVPAVGMPVGKALIIDTVACMELLVREAVSVLVSDADSDDLTRNRCTLLAEGRWASAVWAPGAACIVTLPSLTS
jgi:Phage capsid family